jgi:hypothetical protein
VPRDPSVRVDDDLPAGQPGVRRGPAHLEAATGVDVDLRVLVHQLRREDLADHELADALVDLLRGDAAAVVRADDDGLDALGLAQGVLDRDLGLAVRQQPGQGAVAPHGRQAAGQPVRQRDRQGHQLGRLVGRVPDHHALVARPLALVEVVLGAGAVLERLVDPRGDVRRLLLELHVELRAVQVEAGLGIAVHDAADRVPDDLLHGHVGRRGHLPDHTQEVLGDRGLRRHPGAGVLCQHRVEDGVGYLITDLVRVSLGHGL